MKHCKEQPRSLQGLPGNETGFQPIYHGTHYACFKAEGTINTGIRVNLQFEQFNSEQVNTCTSQGPLSPDNFFHCHLSSFWQLVEMQDVEMQCLACIGTNHQDALLINFRFIKARKKDLQDEFALPLISFRKIKTCDKLSFIPYSPAFFCVLAVGFHFDV